MALTHKLDHWTKYTDYQDSWDEVNEEYMCKKEEEEEKEYEEMKNIPFPEQTTKITDYFNAQQPTQ